MLCMNDWAHMWIEHFFAYFYCPHCGKCGYFKTTYKEKELESDFEK